jgi:hypothetical protein
MLINTTPMTTEEFNYLGGNSPFWGGIIDGPKIKDIPWVFIFF